MEKHFSSRFFPFSGVRAKLEVNFGMQPEAQIRATWLPGCSLLHSPTPSKPKLKKKKHVLDKMIPTSVNVIYRSAEISCWLIH